MNKPVSDPSGNGDGRAVVQSRKGRIGVFYPADPAGHIPGGIDTVIRGILRWAPTDLEYALYSATCDVQQRAVGREALIQLGDRLVRYLPIVSADPSAVRSKVPLTVRYLWALLRHLRAGSFRKRDVLDFHRIEPLLLFNGDARPRNLMIHQDMAVSKNKDCDIGWRHALKLYEYLEAVSLKRIDHLFWVRQSAVDRYRKIYPAISDKFTFMPTWVDTSMFYPCSQPERQSLREDLVAEFGLPASSQFLISVGRLDRQKDPLFLLKALETVAAKLARVHLILIGDGNLRAEVEERISAARLQERVSILGALPPQKIAKLLRASDAFVLSSAYEGMPIVVLEALATGLTVIATDVGEVRRVVFDGVNGSLVTERLPQSMADAILRVLAKVDVLRGRPCERAVAPYVPERVLSKIYDHHASQIARRSHEASSASQGS